MSAELLAVAAIALASGTLIGMMGVGGVILVPLLTGALGLPLVASLAATTSAFLASGLVAVALQARQGHLHARGNLLLWATAGLGALAGAAAVVQAPPAIVAGFIALVAIVAGVASFVGRAGATAAPAPSPSWLAALGAVTGFGSALSGTGGAVMLLPLLLLRGAAVRPAIAYAQSVQVPIALFASAVYLGAGLVQLPLAAATALGLVPGTVLGTRIARRLPYDLLRRTVAAVLVAVGAWYFYTLL